MDGWAFSVRKIYTERAGGNTEISSGNRSKRPIDADRDTACFTELYDSRTF